MRLDCPYCSETVNVVDLEGHVRRRDGNGHGAHGTVPVERVDNPWNVRIETRLDEIEPRQQGVPDEAANDDGAVPTVEYVESKIRKGRCPACKRGILGMKGGDGWLSSGRRRLACINCRWESPEWITIRE